MIDSAAVEAPEPPEVQPAPEETKKRGGRPKGSLNKATRDVRLAAQKYTKRALTVIARLAEQSEDPRVQLQAAQELLDRAHGKPAQTQLLGGTGEEPIRSEVYEAIKDDPRELARRSVVLLESMGIREQVERSFGIEPGQNGHAALPQPPQNEPIDVEATEIAPEAESRADGPPGPSFDNASQTVRGIASGLEIRQMSLIPPANYSLWLGTTIEVRNHGKIIDRPNTGELLSIWRDGVELQKPTGWPQVEKALDKLITEELPFSQIPTVPSGLRASMEALDQGGWLKRLKR